MKDKGFTLIEMMATIAIISILTGVVVANYSGVRTRAHLKDAETMMNTMRSAVELCVFRNSNLNAPDPVNLTCANSTVSWANISTFAPGWSYVGASDTDVSDRTYTFSATNGTNTITCNEVSCITTP